MDIVSALFAENIDLRQVPGPSTRIDLTGIMFSMPAPSMPPAGGLPSGEIACESDHAGESSRVLDVHDSIQSLRLGT